MNHIFTPFYYDFTITNFEVKRFIFIDIGLLITFVFFAP